MSKPLQTQILEDILSRFPKRAAAVEALATLFGVQKDAVYRRLRGDTLLTPDEISLLAKTYNLSLDKMVSEDSSMVSFSFSPFVSTITSVGQYLQNISDDLTQVLKLPDVHVYYVSFEIPFFYYAFFPELISFKLYIWGKTIWDFDYLKDRPFDFDVFSYPDEKIIDEVLKSFLSLNTTEIWSVNILDNTLNQIEYFVNTGGFKNPEDAYVLCDKLKELVEQWRKMAEHGKKFPLGNYDEGVAKGDFHLYEQELLITSNLILVSSPLTKLIYPIISNPNYLRSNDKKMCDFQEEWFKRAISKSIFISTQNEKSRASFFNTLIKKINGTRRRIETALDEF